jgi:hypothetical protein
MTDVLAIGQCRNPCGDNPYAHLDGERAERATWAREAAWPLHCLHRGNQLHAQEIRHMRKLMKLAAYAKAPRATFFLLHPVRALKWGAMFYVGKKVYERVRNASERLEEEVPSAR